MNKPLKEQYNDLENETSEIVNLNLDDLSREELLTLSSKIKTLVEGTDSLISKIDDGIKSKKAKEDFKKEATQMKNVMFNLRSIKY